MSLRPRLEVLILSIDAFRYLGPAQVRHNRIVGFYVEVVPHLVREGLLDITWLPLLLLVLLPTDHISLTTSL